jgi:hypothetical protein
MLLEDLLWLILAAVVARAVAHVFDGLKQGLAGRSRQARDGNVPAQGVQMARDPVCGTYVIPDRALMATDGSRQVFFCSPGCRDKYHARTA